MKFQCSKCGACCRRAGLFGLMPSREDGACIHLAEDNTCMIYETRPEICRVERMAERNREMFDMSTKEYFAFTNNLCNKWIKEDGMQDSYLIDIGKYDRTDPT